MKSLYTTTMYKRELSHPARGAWIEMSANSGVPAATTSHPARGAWIEICSVSSCPFSRFSSHPARGAWIEIFQPSSVILTQVVAPRKGCVD